MQAFQVLVLCIDNSTPIFYMFLCSDLKKVFVGFELQQVQGRPPLVLGIIATDANSGKTLERFDTVHDAARSLACLPICFVHAPRKQDADRCGVLPRAAWDALCSAVREQQRKESCLNAPRAAKIKPWIVENKARIKRAGLRLVVG